MAQSDYLQRKKMRTVLTPGNQLKFNNVLDSEDYTQYKQYSLENTIINTSDVYNQIVQPNMSIIFGMQVQSPTTCPQFVVCNNTQTRPYRMKQNTVAFNPSVSMSLPYMVNPGDNYKKQNTFVKQRPNNKCSSCCYNNTKNKNKKTNNQNTNFTTCSNARFNKMMCDCSMN